jgi:pre-mRNA-splicing factor CWC22
MECTYSFLILNHICLFFFKVLRCIRLTIEDTISSSRVFIKHLFLELTECLGVTELNTRLTDP